MVMAFAIPVDNSEPSAAKCRTRRGEGLTWGQQVQTNGCMLTYKFKFMHVLMHVDATVGAAAAA
jgi:hypothetical protein